MKKTTFLEFCNQLRGFNFYDKISGTQIFKYELYYRRMSIKEIKEKYNQIERKQIIEETY